MMRTLIAFLIALLALPAAAAAQRSGVFVDPETPAGTEYAIPLEEARRHGAPSGEKGGAGGGSGSQPLFGVGIERAPSDSASGGGSAAGGAGAGASAGGGEPGGEGEGSPDGSGDKDRRAPEALESARDRPAPVAVEAAARGGSEALLTAAIAGSVLAIGLLVGFGLRRLLRTE